MAREGGRQRVGRCADAPRDPLRRARRSGDAERVEHWMRAAAEAAMRTPRCGRGASSPRRQRDRSGTVDRAFCRSRRSAGQFEQARRLAREPGKEAEARRAAHARRGSRQSRRGLGDGAERERPVTPARRCAGSRVADERTRGNPRATRVGNRYAKGGDGVEQDFAQARAWYRRRRPRVMGPRRRRSASSIRPGGGADASPSEAAKWF